MSGTTLTASRLPGTQLSDVAVDFDKLPGYSRIWQEIAVGSQQSFPPFAREAASRSACRAAAKEQLNSERPWADLAAVLEQSSRHFGVPTHTLERLERLAKGKAVVVVTGQQVGYLGGPLFTFLKAYHATRLAAELEQELGVTVLPVFWLEGEDHDLEEVRHAHYLHREGDAGTLTFAPAEVVSNLSVGLYQLQTSGDLETLAAALPAQDAPALELFRSAYARGNLSDGMGRFIASVLGPRGLLLVEGMNRDLKRLALPLWERIIERGTSLNELLAARSLEVESAGYPAPIHSTPDSYLFYVLDSAHRRCAIATDGSHACDSCPPLATTNELLKLVRREPFRLSPKASLRPLYQDFVLPSIAYIAGPGELSYHMQLAPFYRTLGVTAPSLFPRLSATIMDRKTARNLEKLGLTAAQLMIEPEQSLRKQLLEQADETGAEQQFLLARAEIQAVYDRLKSFVAGIDPTLEGLASSSAGKSLQPLEQLHEKTTRAIKQRHATLLSRFDKAVTQLKPGGKLSERYYAAGYYFARFGQEQLLTALDNVPLAHSAHHIITLD